MFPIPSHLPRGPTNSDPSASDPIQPEERIEVDLTLDLLAPFFGNSASQAGPSRWTAKQATEVRAKLEQAVQTNKARQHDLLLANFATVSSHIQLANTLRSDHADVAARLKALEADIDPSDPDTSFLSPVLTQLDRHFKAITRRSRASAHIRALKALQKQAEYVERLEKAIWSGRGADGWVIEALNGDGRLGEGLSDEMEGTKVAAAVQTRLQLFKSMLLEQVSDAFNQAVLLTVPKDGRGHTTLRVSGEIKLSQPRIPRPEEREGRNPTRSDAPHTYSLTELYSALSQLGALPSLLQALSARISRDIVHPLLSQGRSSRLERDNVDVQEIRLLRSSSPSPASLISYTSIFLDFLTSSVFPPSDLAERQTFLSDLTSSTLATLLQQVLLPAMPSTIASIPDWLNLLNQAVELESSVQLDPPIIRPFAEDQAGGEWVGARTRNANEEVKNLVLNGWGGWDAKEVEREKEVSVVVEVEVEADDEEEDKAIQPISLQQKKTSKSGGAGETSEGESLKANEEAVKADPDTMDEDVEGGWGFDEEDNKPTPDQNKTRTDKATSTTGTETKNESQKEDNEVPDEGWDFDMNPEPSTAVPSTAKSTAKPVREAKKLGKRVAKAKQAEAELDPEMDIVSQAEDVSLIHSITDRQSEIFSDGPQAETRDEAADEDGWGWDEAPGSAVAGNIRGGTGTTSTGGKANNTTILPEKRKKVVLKDEERIVKETYLVSKACDRIIEIVERCLNESKALSQSSLPPTFTSSSPLLQSAAIATLDIFRALIFTSQSSALRDVPTLSMQLSNDFSYISSRLSALAEEYHWDANDVIRRMKAAGEHIFEMQLGVQREGLMGLLDESEGFEGTGMVTGAKRCERVVKGVEHNLDSLARVLKVVLPTSSFFVVIGYLIDVVVQRISEEVLALLDITEAESEKLNDLLKILHPLEKAFSEAEPPTSIVTHVPHWLKYQYISELLSANLVDITYLFDTGALVDFTTEELVSVIKALFADSEKRDKAIERIEAGAGHSRGGGGSAST